jgi:hypothetical protein
MEDCRLRVFENKVLRKIFVPERDEKIKDQEKFDNIFRVIK